MINLVRAALVTSGLFELMYLCSLNSSYKRYESLKEATHADWKKMSEVKKGELLASAVISLMYIPFALFEVVSVTLGTVYLGSPMSWLLMSTLLIGFVTGGLRSILPSWAFKAWYVLDFLYCAAVLIGGTLYFS